jgi:hypothetical protein
MVGFVRELEIDAAGRKHVEDFLADICMELGCEPDNEAILQAISRLKNAESCGWQLIDSAPRDGTWFVIFNANCPEDGYEVGKYDPAVMPEYIRADTEAELYYKKSRPVYDWRGFNNFHRATHWQPVRRPNEFMVQYIRDQSQPQS